MVQLTRSLAEESGLSMPDYEVLVMLTDTPEGRVRMAALADKLEWERSRLSHHIRRMEARGLVERRECQEDGRGAFVGITPLGQRTIERAAPGHVSAVRRHFIDVLGKDGLDALEKALEEDSVGRVQLGERTSDPIAYARRFRDGDGEHLILIAQRPIAFQVSSVMPEPRDGLPPKGDIRVKSSVMVIRAR